MDRISINEELRDLKSNFDTVGFNQTTDKVMGCDDVLDDSKTYNENTSISELLKRELADLFEDNLKQYNGANLNNAIWLGALKYNPDSEKVSNIKQIVNDVYSNLDERAEFFKHNKTKYMLEEVAKFNEGYIRSDNDIEFEDNLINLEIEFKTIADECISLKNRVDILYKSTHIPFNIRNNDIDKLLFKIEYNIFKSDIKYKNILLDFEIMDILDDLRKNYCSFTENKKNVFYGLMLRDIFDSTSDNLTNIIKMLTNNENYFDNNVLQFDINKIKGDLNKILNEIKKK